VMRQIRRAQDIPHLRLLLEQWKVRYFIARKPEHRKLQPLLLRRLLESCTQPEYELANYYVARLEPACGTIEPPPVVVVKPGTYDDFDERVQFRGDWVQNDDFAEPFRHTVSYSDDPGAEVGLSFEGTSLTYVFTKAPNRGVAEIAIDGVLSKVLDLYSPTVAWQSRLEFAGLSPGSHTIAIRVVGRKQAASQGLFVDVDAFEVR